LVFCVGDINMAVQAYASYSIADLKHSIVEHAQQVSVDLPLSLFRICERLCCAVRLRGA
jgi:hypothetical protein